MTVREFIDELLTSYPDEWGYIGIYKEGEWFGYPRCEYKWGKLLYSLPEEYLDKQIEKVSGHGGWSNSDFILHLAKDVVEADPKDQYKADMMTVLEELLMEINELHSPINGMDFGYGYISGIVDASKVIQEKIIALKENTDE
jgi:hypothetical protein